jgi:transcription elongation factor
LFDDVSSKSIRPWNLDSNTASDADTDLGVSSQRFKDLYLSGGVYLGGTGSANKLDDYEEGTFTPTVTLGITSPTYSTQSGAYTKVGNLVSFALRVNLTAGTANASRVEIGGLPFTSSTTVSGSNGAAMLAYSNDVFDTTEATTFYISGNSTEVGFYNRDGNSFLGNQVNTPASFNVNIVGFYYTSS